MKKRKAIILFLIVCQLSIFAQDYKYGKVSKEELEERYYPLDSTAEAAYLYTKRRTYFDYVSSLGFVLKTDIHQRIKIYKKEGFKQATKLISYYKPDVGDDESVSSIKGYTFNLEDGKIVKIKLTKNTIFTEKVNKDLSRKKIAMPGVKEGSVIELKYTISSPYYAYIRDLEFQHGIPVKKLDFKIETPEYFSFNKRNIGYYFVPMEREKKNGRIGSLSYNIDVYKFKGANIPSLKDDEPFVSSIDNYRGGMKFELTQTNFLSIGGGIKNYATTWEDVSKQIYRYSSFGSELDKTGYYKNDLAIILTTAKTDIEKIGTIFQFVKMKVKWNGNYSKYTDKGVRKAYKEREGNVADINLMLTSMLRSAGLDANPVLVSTRDNGIPLFPTIKGFNYVIAMVTLNDGSYVLLDGTEKYSLPNLLPTRVLNWKGRKVTKEGVSSWVQLVPDKHVLKDQNMMVKVKEDNFIEGLLRTKYFNMNALSYRTNNNSKKEEDLIAKLEDKNKIEITAYKLLNKENLGKPIIRTIQFDSEDLIEEINDKLYVAPLLFLTKNTNPFKLEDRKYPVDFAIPWKEKNTVSIQVPEGYKVGELPESMAVGLPDNLGVFKYQVKEVGNKVKAVSILQFNTAVISPQYYQFLKQFYRQMVKKQSEKVVFTKK